jgi:hypothetical protein
MDDLYDIARRVTDEVLGEGTYAELNKDNPDPGVQAAIRRQTGAVMGWWNADGNGGIAPQRTEAYWGDEPADSMDNAIHEIAGKFQSAWGRKPTKQELRAGLEFALGSYDENEKEK